MNADQRKFLVERVNKTFTQQKEKLKDKEITRPSLNNYLVAAFLDNSIQFNDLEKLKEKMRKTVLSFGSSDVIVQEKDKYGYNRRRRSDDDDDGAKEYCEVDIKDLFVIPQAYLDELKKYQDYMDDLKGKMEQLEAQRDTILLKIQIGSNQVLDKLITQVDNLADLNIMNSQFLLSGPEDKQLKSIENSK